MPSSQHEARDAAGEIEARENARPLDQARRRENIEGVGQAGNPFTFRIDVRGALRLEERDSGWGT